MEYRKNDIVTVQIDDIGNDGEGIGKIDGFTLFVKDAVIGDTVEAKITKIKKNYGYARTEKIIKPSSFRVEPKCAFHRQCGGCQIQAMSYERQLLFKQEKIRNNLIHIGGFDAEAIDKMMEPVVGMEHPWRYRNKAQFPVGYDKNGNLITGFYAGRTHDIIPNTDCILGTAENKQILEAVLSYMKENHVPAYREQTGEGLVRHILIRTGFASGEIMVCLIINGTKLPAEKELIKKMTGLSLVETTPMEDADCRQGETEEKNAYDKENAAKKKIVSISVSVNTERTNVIMGKEIRVLWGRGYIEDSIRILGAPEESRIKFRISPLSFYQVNPEQTEKLYSLALACAGLTGKETVWDLYCGIGTISLFLARYAQKVYGVEIIPQAVEDAKENARISGIDNAEFYVGKAEEVLPEKFAGEGIRADVIVVDPPRKGCDDRCLETMLAMKPERIVYVSCDSATLARDLKVLCGGGYELRKVQGVDLFGGTVHVETCVLLTHKKPTSYIEVTMDYEKIVSNQKPGKATYKMITDYVKEKYDLVVKSTTIAEVKRSFGLEVGDYNVKEEKTNYRKEKITPEKRQAVEDALRHFGVIE